VDDPAVFLVIHDPGGRRQRFELHAGATRFTIGRRTSCDIALPWDAEVSRLHAQLVRLGADLIVQDDGLSHNGTFVNGERVRGRRRLQSGDLLTVGATTLAVGGPEANTSVHTHDANRPPSTLPALTPAQQRVLDALARPLHSDAHALPASNRAIADELSLSIDTVKGTLSTLYERYGLGHLSQHHKRATLAQRAFSAARSA
jgi:pSer/pThr/pTyr-binding forkhead associated (FHA) protein